MNEPPKKMLIELPSADEIDDLAITTPKFEVRKFEIDLSRSRADLKYPPCKAQVITVVRGPKGTTLVRTVNGGNWTVPSGRVGATEEIPGAARRVAKDEVGLPLRSMELAGIYDVIWHYSDLTIKRLHFVYAGVTDDEPDPKLKSRVQVTGDPELLVSDEISRAALSDCKDK